MSPVRSSKKAEAAADGNAVALGTAATAFFHGAGIGASMMLFQALSDAVARVSWILEEEEEGDETEKRELKFCSRQLLLDEKKHSNISWSLRRPTFALCFLLSVSDHER